MQALMEALANNVEITIIGVVILAGMTLKAITTVIAGFARERSRREIAAYIAEGSISPEQGERLLKADVSAGRRV
jgi:hypothetical protein